MHLFPCTYPANKPSPTRAFECVLERAIMCMPRRLHRLLCLQAAASTHACACRRRPPMRTPLACVPLAPCTRSLDAFGRPGNLIWRQFNLAISTCRAVSLSWHSACRGRRSPCTHAFARLSLYGGGALSGKALTWCFCVQYVYFARPDSRVFGEYVT